MSKEKTNKKKRLAVVQVVCRLTISTLFELSQMEPNSSATPEIKKNWVFQSPTF